MPVENWFATPIYYAYADESEYKVIDTEVEQAIPKYNNDDLNEPWGDNIKVTFTYEGKNNIQEDIPQLSEWVTQHAYAFTQQCGRVASNIKLQESWFNFYKKYSYQNWHDHYTGAVYSISGVYYHKVAEDGGIIEFKDSSQIQNTATFPSNCNNMNYFSTVRYTPEVGKLILFPSYLQHCVEYVKSDTDRISLAFNFKVEF